MTGKLVGPLIAAVIFFTMREIAEWLTVLAGFASIMVAIPPSLLIVLAAEIVDESADRWSTGLTLLVIGITLMLIMGWWILLFTFFGDLALQGAVSA